jgi:hypothetical protein
MRAVLGNECRLIGRNVLFWEDRADRTGWDASATVDALVRVNVKLVVAFVNAFDGANFDAGRIFGADAGLSNDVGHVGSSLGKTLEIEGILIRIIGETEVESSDL